MAATTPKRIAITGPESTGKSILSQQLADYYGEPWVPEYSREYLELLKTNYTFSDILEIAKGQFNRELRELSKAKMYLFCDTDFLVSHIWCMVRFGVSHKWIDEMLSKKQYDFTLLCNTDLPWQYDPLRENPDDRDYLFSLYEAELKKQGAKYAIVEGIGQARLDNALKILRHEGIV